MSSDWSKPMTGTLAEVNARFTTGCTLKDEEWSTSFSSTFCRTSWTFQALSVGRVNEKVDVRLIQIVRRFDDGHTETRNYPQDVRSKSDYLGTIVKAEVLKPYEDDGLIIRHLKVFWLPQDGFTCICEKVKEIETP
jgi:hypothetical protein